MRRVLITTVLALGACGGRTDADARIAKLENEVARLKDANAQLFTNDEALRKGATEFVANIAAVLQVTGIIEQDNKTPSGRWWCNPVTCARAEIDCTVDVARLSDGKDRVACQTQRIAWCRGDGGMDHCLQSLDACLRTAKGERIGRTCIGVE